jgi:hypothetical protein
MYAKVHHREIRVLVLVQLARWIYSMLVQSLLLLKVNHLHPYMLNLAYREKLDIKFLYQLIPISLDFYGCEWIPLNCFIDKLVGEEFPFKPIIRTPSWRTVLHSIVKCWIWLYGLSVSTPRNRLVAAISMIRGLISYLVSWRTKSNSCILISSHRGLA